MSTGIGSLKKYEEKTWYGLRVASESIELAVSFYIDEENGEGEQIQLFKTKNEAVRELLSHPDSDLKLFSLTYKEIPV